MMVKIRHVFYLDFNVQRNLQCDIWEEFVEIVLWILVKSDRCVHTWSILQTGSYLFVVLQKWKRVRTCKGRDGRRTQILLQFCNICSKPRSNTVQGRKNHELNSNFFIPTGSKQMTTSTKPEPVVANLLCAKIHLLYLKLKPNIFDKNEYKPNGQMDWVPVRTQYNEKRRERMVRSPVVICWFLNPPIFVH